MDTTELKAELLRLMKDDPDLRVAILAVVDPVRLKADLVEAVREGVGDMLDAWGANPCGPNRLSASRTIRCDVNSGSRTHPFGLRGSRGNRTTLLPLHPHRTHARRGPTVAELHDRDGPALIPQPGIPRVPDASKPGSACQRIPGRIDGDPVDQRLDPSRRLESRGGGVEL